MCATASSLATKLNWHGPMSAPRRGEIQRARA
eukprot:CAMPEP_0198552284 /NCGR_PEP_ID=MMETSP1462-20131121/78325_1 /TAXON_ID=1333877 /ORGANISM="Brandtodinium nutriculum, Strain RCC3387" /LENGTH=31 /DNA_ID= /DNA_START= /DNA_END= /DNA_ORIENTATION=